MNEGNDSDVDKGSWVLGSSYGKVCTIMVSVMMVMVGVMIRVSTMIIKHGCVVLAILVTIRLRVSTNIMKDEGEHLGDDDYGFRCVLYNGSMSLCDDGRFC